MAQEIEPKQTPALNIPRSFSTVLVSAINTKCDLVCASDGFIEPILKGHENLNLPTLAFLIENKLKGKKILFDLGARKDWWNLAPVIVERVRDTVPHARVEKSIHEILEEGGVDLHDISSLVVSHWHWDHLGDPSRFPKTAELVVGPGFKEELMPGYPTNPTANLLDSDFSGREVREIPFDDGFRIGQYSAYDFFGDGSFYLLNVPGHATGHIAGLARTTADTFVFMGGDVCHFGGSFRPTAFSPMPAEIPADVPLDSWFPKPCPCSIFTASHPHPEKARVEPYYRVTLKEGSWYTDPPVAQQSVDKLQDFDASPNVLVAVAHDIGLFDVLEYFPHSTINDWKAKGWKRRGQWGFLNELPVEGRPPKPYIASGWMKDGKLLE